MGAEKHTLYIPFFSQNSGNSHTQFIFRNTVDIQPESHSCSSDLPGIVQMISPHRKTNYWDAMIGSLIYAVMPQMREEQPCLGVTKNIILWHPFNCLDV